MKFSYKELATGHVRPIIPIAVRNPKTKKSTRYYGLIDSGSDTCIFSSEIADVIGIDVKSGREQPIGGVVEGQRRSMYFHTVEVEIAGWTHSCEVAFMPDLAKNGHGLLGRNGFFNRFSFVKFEQGKESIELGAHR